MRAASRNVEQERNRLAALMAELTQSVRRLQPRRPILLYNGRARAQLPGCHASPSAAGGAELIGLGRSIYSVFDRALIAHALESVQQRLARGAANPSAQFVTSTPAGQLLRVNGAGARAAAPREPHTLDGFVLMLDNITATLPAGPRDHLLHDAHRRQPRLARQHAGRARDARLPDLERRCASASRRSCATRSGDGARVQALPAQRAGAEDALAAGGHARRRPAGRGVPAHRGRIGCRARADEVDPTLWLKVDSYSLLQALAYLAGRLVDEYGVKLGAAAPGARRMVARASTWCGAATRSAPRP